MVGYVLKLHGQPRSHTQSIYCKYKDYERCVVIAVVSPKVSLELIGGCSVGADCPQEEI